MLRTIPPTSTLPRVSGIPGSSVGCRAVDVQGPSKTGQELASTSRLVVGLPDFEITGQLSARAITPTNYPRGQKR